MSAFALCIVIPTLNERENITELLSRLQTTLQGIAYEVIVVDDDSPDGTAAAARKLPDQSGSIHVIHRIGRRGLASACIEGMLATSAPFIAVLDADLQHDESILPVMYHEIVSKKLDLVVGSRNVAGGSMGDFSSWRVRLSKLGRRLSGVEKNASLTDPMSGFFMVRRSFFDSVAHRLTGVGFKILLDIVLSSPDPIQVAEVPYRFGARQYGQSKLDLMVGLEYMELLIDKLVGDYISVRFVLFSMVGALGAILHLFLLGLLLKGFSFSFPKAQATATGVTMILNYVLNNSWTYRERRRHGLAFWLGMLSFCIACSLGAMANLAVSTEAFRKGIPWFLAGIMGLIFSAFWNYGITSMITWRQTKRLATLRAARRALAVAKMEEAS